MKHEALLDAAGLVADGEEFDLASVSSSLSSDEERGIADELAVVARIAAAHRRFHQVLPADAPGTERAPFASSWGHLDLIEIVGRGSYGTVYRAWDPRLDRLVALKLFHGARNPEAVMREGRMLARIRHENVVTVYGADVYNGIAGIWMEFVHGKRLDQIVDQQGPLSAEEATLVGLAVCRALVAVHGAGLLHCDVKAQNVIREPGGRIVLMDLGAGRSTRPDDDSTSKLQVAGTPRYMAPEVFDRGNAIPQSDVYSVGVLLFYLVSGRFPVDGKTLSEIRKAHLDKQRVQLGDVRADLPAEFVRDVTRALDPNPLARHATAGELEAGLLGIPSVGTQMAALPVSRKGAQWIGLTALLVALLIAGLGWRVGRPTPAPGRADGARGIAVLPIKNLTGDASRGYLADGLTEVLISNLARIKGFSVPPAAAVAAFRDTTEPPGSVANKLGVELLLAGSLLEFGDRARVVVNLIDPKTNKVIWSDDLARDGPALVSVQGEIARMVANYLGVGLSSAEDRALQQAALDPRALDAYLRGLAASETVIDLKGSQAALEQLRRATDLDPGFADAWAQQALEEMRFTNLSANVDRRQRAQVVRVLADRALKLDPSSPRAYLALGSSQFYNDWDFATAEQTLRAGLEHSPSSAITLQRLSMLLAARQRFDEAIELGEKASALERLQPSRYALLGTLYTYAKRFDEAEAVINRAFTVNPDFAPAHYALARVYAARGRYDDAIERLEKALVPVRLPGYVAELARVHTAAGHRADADRLIQELQRRRDAGEGLFIEHYAYIAAAGGRLDDAFAILDQAVDQRSVDILWLAVDPRADPLRSDPRLERMLARIGLRP